MVCKTFLSRILKGIILIFLLVLLFFVYDDKNNVDAYYSDDDLIIRLHNRETDQIHRVYEVIVGQRVSKVAQMVSVSGYKSEIELLVIIDIISNTVEKVVLLEEHESDDYGAYIQEDWFLERFFGKDVKSPLNLVKVRAESENDVVIVTGATISSAAVVHGVNLCIENYNEMR